MNTFLVKIFYSIPATLIKNIYKQEFLRGNGANIYKVCDVNLTMA